MGENGSRHALGLAGCVARSPANIDKIVFCYRRSVPVGVLYDLFASADELPWNITVSGLGGRNGFWVSFGLWKMSIPRCCTRMC